MERNEQPNGFAKCMEMWVISISIHGIISLTRWVYLWTEHAIVTHICCTNFMFDFDLNSFSAKCKQWQSQELLIKFFRSVSRLSACKCTIRTNFEQCKQWNFQIKLSKRIKHCSLLSIHFRFIDGDKWAFERLEKNEKEKSEQQTYSFWLLFIGWMMHTTYRNNNASIQWIMHSKKSKRNERKWKKILNENRTNQ